MATLKLHLQVRVFPLWQQAVVVLLLLGINQLLVWWIKGIIGTASSGFGYWSPMFIGMLIWPWLFIILRDIRRRAHVS